MGVLERNHVTVRGTGERTIVFAHGLGCDQTVWERVAPAFEGDFRTVLFDYVGAGQSDKSAYSGGRYGSLGGYAKDVVEIADALGLRDAVFVGHSVSGMIGALASLERPNAFSKLVMIGPSPRYLNAPGYPGGFEREDVEELLGMMEMNYLEWAKYMAPVSMQNTDRPALTEELQERFMANDPAIMRQFAEVTFLSDERDILEEIQVPTLILQAREDVVAPVAVGEYIHSHIKGSEFRLIEANGHNPHISSPQETIREIMKFIGE
ncbi:alpha/beta fold hydrolase [Bhargavaea cecembensis]|uniref:alpha/beta fold hydrolase n=1 Tax=Bhargavaea cecembensis TaxID=394098 RepID=UPI00058EE436|nr:alpha/beta hydrolase [Bhargavaea cecembensis]